MQADHFGGGQIAGPEALRFGHLFWVPAFLGHDYAAQVAEPEEASRFGDCKDLDIASPQRAVAASDFGRRRLQTGLRQLVD